MANLGAVISVLQRYLSKLEYIKLRPLAVSERVGAVQSTYRRALLRTEVKEERMSSKIQLVCSDGMSDMSSIEHVLKLVTAIGSRSVYIHRSFICCCFPQRPTLLAALSITSEA